MVVRLLVLSALVVGHCHWQMVGSLALSLVLSSVLVGVVVTVSVGWALLLSSVLVGLIVHVIGTGGGSVWLFQVLRAPHHQLNRYV